jgi:Protein of unknown function (DUF3015)
MRLARPLIAILFLSTAGATAAAAENPAAHGKATFGTAGCGLGSMVFGDQKGAIQILAATTNTLFGTQTFGITFGTSNCGASAVGTAATKSFIEGNREVLAKDAARGSGETITTLSTLAGCKDPAAVGAALQKRFAELFPADKAHTEVSEAVVGALRGDDSLACKAIG